MHHSLIRVCIMTNSLIHVCVDHDAFICNHSCSRKNLLIFQIPESLFFFAWWQIKNILRLMCLVTTFAKWASHYGWDSPTVDERQVGHMIRHTPLRESLESRSRYKVSWVSLEGHLSLSHDSTHSLKRVFCVSLQPESLWSLFSLQSLSWFDTLPGGSGQQYTYCFYSELLKRRQHDALHVRLMLS